MHNCQYCNSHNRVETEREIPKLKFLVVKLICE